MTTNTQIYCVSHKPVALENTGITAIQVGTATEAFCQHRDNTQQHIAQYNALLSELTAHYWVWKNQTDDVVGFCHYRRFLLPPMLTPWLDKQAAKPYADLPPGGVGNYASGYVIDHHRLIEKITTVDYIYLMSEALADAEVLLPLPNRLPNGSFYRQYSNAHPVEPFYSMLAEIAKQDNDRGKAALEFFTTHPHAYWNNLYVMRRELFEELCDFQFSVLLAMLEQPRDFPDIYQNRYAAFLSERLFNFWLYDRKPSIKTLPWCMTESVDDGEDPHQRKIQPKNRYRPPASS